MTKPLTSACCGAEIKTHHSVNLDDIAFTYCSKCHEPISSLRSNQHKPWCASNRACAVYHADGKCPGYKECNCKPTTAQEASPTPEDWQQDFFLKYEKFFGLVPEWDELMQDISDLAQKQYEAGYNEGYQVASEKAGHHFLYEEIPARESAARKTQLLEDIDTLIDQADRYKASYDEEMKKTDMGTSDDFAGAIAIVKESIRDLESKLTNLK